MTTTFISCGQYTENEKRLGKEVRNVVRRFSYEPYFAENQSSLKGLHENILTKLNQCSGLITIMHPRGEVKYSASATHIRGSVWIEQEIAIAAFMTQCLGRNIEVAAFIHADIKREGIRDLLHLNPISFRSDAEVVEQVSAILAKWNLQSSAVRLKISYNKVKITADRHDYALEIFAENTGSTRIEQYALDLSFPNAFLNQSRIDLHQLEVVERRTTTHRYFRATEHHHPNQTIFPGDTKRIFALDYFVDHQVCWQNTAMGQTFKAALRYGNEPPITQERHISDFQNF